MLYVPSQHPTLLPYFSLCVWRLLLDKCGIRIRGKAGWRLHPPLNRYALFFPLFVLLFFGFSGSTRISESDATQREWKSR